MFDNTWTNSTGNGSNQTMFFTISKKIGEEEHKTRVGTKKNHARVRVRAILDYDHSMEHGRIPPVDTLYLFTRTHLIHDTHGHVRRSHSCRNWKPSKEETKSVLTFEQRPCFVLEELMILGLLIRNRTIRACSYIRMLTNGVVAPSPHIELRDSRNRIHFSRTGDIVERIWVFRWNC
jgi:hypothetical protein